MSKNSRTTSVLRGRLSLSQITQPNQDGKNKTFSIQKTYKTPFNQKLLQITNNQQNKNIQNHHKHKKIYKKIYKKYGENTE